MLRLFIGTSGCSQDSQVVQWLGICLPMQGAQVRSLVWESHVPWDNLAHKPQLLKPMCPKASAPQQEKPQQWEPRALYLEKACAQQRRPSTAKIIIIIFFLMTVHRWEDRQGLQKEWSVAAGWSGGLFHLFISEPENGHHLSLLSLPTFLPISSAQISSHPHFYFCLLFIKIEFLYHQKIYY